MTTCQMDCEEAGPDSKLAYPPYMIHNWMGEGQPRNASLDRKGIATNAREDFGVPSRTAGCHLPAMAVLHAAACLLAACLHQCHIHCIRMQHEER